MGIYIFPKSTNFLNLSGGTVTGGTYFSPTLSATTLYSGSTELGLIISTFINSATIPDGAYIWTGTSGIKSYKLAQFSGVSDSAYTILASHNSYINSNADYSVILGGIQNGIHSLNYGVSAGSVINGGFQNFVRHSKYSFIGGGFRNVIGYNGTGYFGGYQTSNAIISGQYNKLLATYNSGIFAGGRNTITGDSYTVDAATYASVVLGGQGNTIIGANRAAIIGGNFNLLKHGGENSVIIGGSNITGNSSNMVFVPNLNINNLSSATGTTSNLLVADSNGFVYKKILSGGTNIKITDSIDKITISVTGVTQSSSGNFLPISGGTVTGQTNLFLASATTFSADTYYSGSTLLQTILNNNKTIIRNGINTLTAGTFGDYSINVTALTISSLNTSGITNFFQASATTFSAETYYSGSTLLQNILLNNKTVIQNGLNTYTGGSFGNYTINISAATLSTLSSSGNTNFFRASATTFSATTYYSGTTELSLLFPQLLWVSGNSGTSSVRQNVSLTTANGNYSLVFGKGNQTLGSMSYNTILGGTGNTINISAQRSCSIFGGMMNGISGSSLNSVIVGGISNTLTGSSTGAILAGQANIVNVATRGVIIGGLSNTLTGGFNSGIFSSRSGNINSSPQSVIAGGIYQTINSTYHAGIFAGRSNIISGSSVYSAILGGQSLTINNASRAAVLLGGNINTLNGPANFSGVIGGSGNTINGAVNSVILGGSSYTLTTSNTVMVPKLRVRNAPTTAVNPNVYIDGNGNIFTSTATLNGGSGTLDISGYRKIGLTNYEAWYNSQITSESLTTGILEQDTVYFIPFIVSTAITIDRMAVNVTSVGIPGALAHLGIYNCDSDNLPSNIVISPGDVPIDSTGVQVKAAEGVLNPGLYFFAILPSKSCEVKSMVNGGISTVLGWNADLTDTVNYITAGVSFDSGLPSTKGSATLVAQTAKTIPSIWIRLTTPH